MNNHVHLIAVPERKDSLAIGLGTAHKRYMRMINFREGWRGYLWEGRFKSYPMSEAHLYATLRYVERNPVRAGIVKKSEDYQWSSAKAHVNNFKDKLIGDNFVVSGIKNWGKYLKEDDEMNSKLLLKHIKTSCLLGDDGFIDEAGRIAGKDLRIKKPGPKKKSTEINV